ncbi:hypothetical protein YASMINEVIRUS_5 [Yasminevirus sp. GU-2018]|uniref:Uncharacterized protein n=1 Tax=Yasminevirus sp. GU-2018 TaxID=2420051 RepID=A0A5K0U8A4_9VIRU|nr:hypothetical protein YASMINEVIRUS_5 [Yasminevirus sp. GU-2018]
MPGLTIKERAGKISTIKENISNIPDDILSDVYKIVCDTINKKKKAKDVPSRFEQVQCVENNLRYVDDEHITEIENLIVAKEHEETQQETMKRVALEIANKLLEAKEKPQINNLCDFKITRDEFLSDECKNVIDENKEYIFKNGFSKGECKVGQSGTKYKHLSLFKGMIGQIEGHSLQSKLRFKTCNYERESFTEYYIIKE